MLITPEFYNTFWVNDKTSHVTIVDHMGGFDSQYNCQVLDRLQTQFSNNKVTVESEYIFNDVIKEKYPSIKFLFNKNLWINNNRIKYFFRYRSNFDTNFKNFVCSFNGSYHDSRALLTSALNRFNWFNPLYSSKNIKFSSDHIKGIIGAHNADPEFYLNYFSNNEEFCQTIYSFGLVQFNPAINIYNLEFKLIESFLHLVSETMATSYYPFVTEKFIYSIVTKGLFIAYAHPNWHTHLEIYYGFKKYNKIFNYTFDTIEHPIQRLVALLTMISKFSQLSISDWKDLYQVEKETIEYNYDHYRSGDYLTHLSKIV